MVLLPMCGLSVEFPFKPYPAQLALMARLLTAVRHSQHALLESPTGRSDRQQQEKGAAGGKEGAKRSQLALCAPYLACVASSGKSLALLCAALAWHRQHKREVTAEAAAIRASSAAQEEHMQTRGTRANTAATNDAAASALPLPRDMAQEMLLAETSAAAVAPEEQPMLCEWDAFATQQPGAFAAAAFNPFAPSAASSTAAEAVPASQMPFAFTQQGTPAAAAAAASAAGSATAAGAPPAPKIPKVSKIYFASRTHSQLAQLVSELKATTYRPTMSVLGSRAQYCIHPEVSQSNNKNDDCIKLLEFNECRMARQVHRVSRNENEKGVKPRESQRKVRSQC
jgi:Fanconi anemia group J protein